MFLPKCCGDLINHCRVHNIETDEARRRKQTYTSNKNRRRRKKKKKEKIKGTSQKYPARS